ncbi:hypothetical protein AB0K16_54290, partial [Nonomuraea jabiensis]|uniref:hypothetical protein n=1 Tax=Nonomuraea jabiensis TaxID=882448 RepID=UPI003437937F
MQEPAEVGHPDPFTALAQDIAQLIAARVVQGAALAVVPLSMAILREALPRQRLASAMGLVSG